MSIRFLKLLLLLTTIGFGVVGCEAPTDLPVQSGNSSYGLVQNVGNYFYPTNPGVLLVVSNKLRLEAPDGQITNITGGNDSVRTLGLLGNTSQGQPVFGVSYKYRVSSSMAGYDVEPLRYLPEIGSFGGAYINSTSYFSGERTTASLYTRAVSTDSLTAPCYGRIRSLASDLVGTGSTIWQTDTVYFTTTPNHVALWTKSITPTGLVTFVKSKDLFRPDVPVTTGAQWSYSVWQPSTMIKVINENAPVTVGAGTFNTLHTEITNNQDLDMEHATQKFFAPATGLVKQIDTWWTTTNGTARTKNILTTEVVVVDPDENF